MTTTPGKPFTRLERLNENITHQYQETGVLYPSVDTTYSAQYRVGGGAWQPVPGTVPILDQAEELDVLSATPRLVD